jgi:hypothetical protein
MVHGQMPVNSSLTFTSSAAVLFESAADTPAVREFEAGKHWQCV